MKRILTILLAVMMLFSFTGCDPDGRAKLAGYMGKMGQNVLGADIASVDKVVDMVKVDKTKIQSPTVGGEAVKISDNVSMKVEMEGDKVVTKVTVGEVEVKVDAHVQSVLPPMENKDKDALVEEIGNTIKSPEKKTAFVEKMSAKETDEKIITATAGSAAVMKAAIEQVADSIPVPDNPEQKKQIEELKKSITGLTSNLDKIATSTESVSKADVVTIQLVQNFVETVSIAKIEPGNVPAEVLTEASNLLTVTTALSGASKFDTGSVIDSLSSVISDATANTESRSLISRAPADAADGNDRLLDPEVQNYFNLIYKAVADVLSNDNFEATKNGLVFHSRSYENYVSMLATKVDLTFEMDATNETATPKYDTSSSYLHTDEYDDFKTFEGVVQYAVAAAIPEADDFYHEIKTLLSNGVDVEIDYYNKEKGVTEYKWETIKVDVSNWADNVRDLFNEFVRENPWLGKTPEKGKSVEFNVPEQYASLFNDDNEMNKFGSVLLNTLLGRDFDFESTLNPAKRQYCRNAMETVNKAIVFTGLGDLTKNLGFDINFALMDFIDDSFVESTLMTKDNHNEELK